MSEDDPTKLCACGGIMRITEDVYRLPVRQFECPDCHATKPTYDQRRDEA